MGNSNTDQPDFSNTPILELAGKIAHTLSQHNIQVVLVGGLAVEVYTDNLYLTKDIDMVNTNYSKPSDLQRAMGKLGFFKQGRVFINPTTKISVEFPPSPLAVGDELITETTTVQTSAGDIPIMKVEDVVKDRLAAYLHWSDHQSLVQAVALMLNHQLTPNQLHDFYKREGFGEPSELFEEFFHSASDASNHTMEQLSTMLSDLLLEKM